MVIFWMTFLIGCFHREAPKMASVFVSQKIFAGGVHFWAINDSANLLDYFMSGHEFGGRRNDPQGRQFSHTVSTTFVQNWEQFMRLVLKRHKMSVRLVSLEISMSCTLYSVNQKGPAEFMQLKGKFLPSVPSFFFSFFFFIELEEISRGRGAEPKGAAKA